MTKILAGSKVWVGPTLYFLVIFLLLGLVALAGGNALGQHQGTSPHFLHFSSNLRTNLASTTDPQSAQSMGNALFEDTKMADVTIYVSSQAELYEALASATGGETFALEGGDYGNLILETAKTFGVQAIYEFPVTIRSADGDNPATFSGITLDGVENLHFENINFESNYTGAEVWVSPFKIWNSKSISITNSTFEGQLATGTGNSNIDGFPTGRALSIKSSDTVTISDSEFSNFHRAIVTSWSSNIEIIGNDIHDIRSDGLDFVQVDTVTIERNYLHDFVTSTGSGDHADMIQFWTSGSSQPSTNITIRENTLDVGEGGATQSIFMRNELVDQGLAGYEMYYKNVLIEENVILNNHAAGISVGETDGLIVRNNTVLDGDAAKTATVHTPKIDLSSASTNVVVEGNVAAALWGYEGQDDWLFSKNVLIQNSDPNAEGYYESEFLSSSLFGLADAYVVDPNGMIAQWKAGATRLLYDPARTDVRPIFDVCSNPDVEGALIFDARLTTGVDISAVDSSDFLWSFGDGSYSFGRIVSHTYSSPGRYSVTLSLPKDDGSFATATTTVGYAGSDLLTFNSATGLFEIFGYGSISTISATNASLSDSEPDAPIVIGAGQSSVKVESAKIMRFFGADGFDISLTLRANSANSTGEVARIHGNFSVAVRDGGELEVKFFGTTQLVVLTATDHVVNDGLDHDIRVAFDSTTDSLLVYIDDVLAASASTAAEIRTDYVRDLHFGNGFGSPVFDGTISKFDLDVHRLDYSSWGSFEFLSPSFSSEVDSDGSNISSISGDVVPLEGEGISLQSMDGYELNLDLVAAGDVGRLGGNAVVGNLAMRQALFFDGKNDNLFLGDLDEMGFGAELTVDIEFTKFGLSSKPEVLLSHSSVFILSLAEDAIRLAFANSSGKGQKTEFSANVGNFEPDDVHSIRVIADDSSDHLQVILDGEIVLDEVGREFSLLEEANSSFWWSNGWVLGGGTRRENDFYGAVFELHMDDTALFVL